jgi:hypothetical protein
MSQSYILQKYEEVRSIHSDINEHLETLKRYSEECGVVVEMGVRKIVSTWAFLAANPKKMISLDLYSPDRFGGNLQEVYDAVQDTDINFEFVEKSSLEYDLDNCELLFIDTWHDYLQLKKELYRHHRKVQKYIILHDTVSFGFVNEGSGEPGGDTHDNINLPTGLIPAVEEFLDSNKDWIIWERKVNNNGLTVLKKIDK